MADPIEETLQRWETTVQTIKTILRDLAEALNTNTCKLDNPKVLEAYDADFVARKSPYWFRESAMTLQDYIDRMGELVKANPGLLLKVVALDVAYVDETHADATSQIEIHNAPEGTRRQVVTSLSFHLKDGRWQCFTAEAIGGFDADDSQSFVPGTGS